MKLPVAGLLKTNAVEVQKSRWLNGIISFVSGVLAATMFMLSFTCTGGVNVLLCGMVFFSISAIVSGAVGLSRPMSGFAIAGFTLGVMVVIPLLYIVVLYLW